MLTKDYVPVVVHDEQLGRTIAGSGLICELTLHELSQLDAGSWFAPEFAATRVPAYLDVLKFCAEHAIWMNVEIKPAQGFEQLTGEIVAQTTRDFYRDSALPLPLFSSFSMTAIESALAVAPDIPRGLLFDRIPDDWLAQIRKFKAVALHTNHKYLTSEAATQIKQAGLGLRCYTVNDPARAREIMHWGVDAVFTDNLKTIGADFI